MRRTDLAKATPDWPCPQCGEEEWRVEPPLTKPRTSPVIWPAFCMACHLLVTAHWTDGAWMGRWWDAGKPGSLAEFVAKRAQEMRGSHD